jgi:Cys-tRNA synthase (O-phospho-L-seryl-tRNA:Cys-tRNA synthase)
MDSMEAIFSTNNNSNNYSVSELNYVRDIIENMNKFNQIEVLRILRKHNIMLNENKFGVHINLSELDKSMIDELNCYITYVNTQESTLNSIEKQKEDYKNTYFSKDIKDNAMIFNK